MRRDLCAGTAAKPGPYYGTTNACIGSEIPFEKALVSSGLLWLGNAPPRPFQNAA